MVSTVWSTDFTERRSYQAVTRSNFMIRRIVFLIALISIIFTTTYVVHAFNSSSENQLTPVQSSPQQLEHIIVKPGMSLWTIASDLKPAGVSTREYMAYLMKINGLDSPVIQVGDVISAP